MTPQKLITDYIADVWMDGDAEGLEPQTPIAELNIIDSAGVFDLVHFLQTEFRITVPLHEVSLDNFRSVSAIAALVDRLRSDDRRKGGPRKDDPPRGGPRMDGPRKDDLPKPDLPQDEGGSAA
ncbi:acyl carrier protein [Streptomyces sp. NEAU-NA10]|uniref:acyl carrier protein n=1 Tax=Streptomyces sp. NEAU-NA10 TaxID=3416050 RepID=UPI003CC61748